MVEAEEILYADVDSAVMSAAKWIFDAAGHYARPDVFRLSVNRAHNPILTEASDEGPAGPAPWTDTESD